MICKIYFTFLHRKRVKKRRAYIIKKEAAPFLIKFLNGVGGPGDV
jgi:hypothetical protein